jgi:hypothetical protein
VSLDFTARRHAKNATGSSPVALVSAKYAASIDRVVAMEITRRERRAGLGEQSGNSLVPNYGDETHPDHFVVGKGKLVSVRIKDSRSRLKWTEVN